MVPFDIVAKLFYLTIEIKTKSPYNYTSMNGFTAKRFTGTVYIITIT